MKNTQQDLNKAQWLKEITEKSTLIRKIRKAAEEKPDLMPNYSEGLFYLHQIYSHLRSLSDSGDTENLAQAESLAMQADYNDLNAIYELFQKRKEAPLDESLENAIKRNPLPKDPSKAGKNIRARHARAIEKMFIAAQIYQDELEAIKVWSASSEITNSRLDAIIGLHMKSAYVLEKIKRSRVGPAEDRAPEIELLQLSTEYTEKLFTMSRWAHDKVAYVVEMLTPSTRPTLAEPHPKRALEWAPDFVQSAWHFMHQVVLNWFSPPMILPPAIPTPVSPTAPSPAAAAYATPKDNTLQFSPQPKQKTSVAVGCEKPTKTRATKLKRSQAHLRA